MEMSGSNDTRDIKTQDSKVVRHFSFHHATVGIRKHAKIDELTNVSSRLSLYACILAIFGVTLIMISSADGVCFNDNTLRYTNPCLAGDLLKLANLLCTIAISALIVKMYISKAEAKAVRYGFSSYEAVFWQSSMMKYYMAMELIVCWVQPYPFVGTSLLGLGHELVAGMFLRLYMVLRVWHDYSPIYKQRNTILKSVTLSATDSNGVVDKINESEERLFDESLHDVDFFGVLKVLFNQNPLRVVAMMAMAVIMLGGYSIHMIERQYFIGISYSTGDIFIPDTPPDYVPSDQLYSPSPFCKMSNSIWFAVVSATTVGYGDITPSSQTGRVIASLIMLCGIISTSLIVGTFAVALAPSPFQVAVLQWVQNEGIREQQDDLAAQILQIAFRFCLQRRRERLLAKSKLPATASLASAGGPAAMSTAFGKVSPVDGSRSATEIEGVVIRLEDDASLLQQTIMDTKRSIHNNLVQIRPLYHKLQRLKLLEQRQREATSLANSASVDTNAIVLEQLNDLRAVNRDLLAEVQATNVRLATLELADRETRAVATQQLQSLMTVVVQLQQQLRGSGLSTNSTHAELKAPSK